MTDTKRSTIALAAPVPHADIVKCKKCGIDISETQAECPGCGDKDPHNE